MGSGSFIIRPAARPDLPGIIELMKALTLTVSQAESDRNPTSSDYDAIFDRILCDPNRKLFVVEIEGKIVAAADLFIMPNLSHHGLPWALLENVVVAEGMRRQGIGRKLLEYLIKTAKESGCYKIGLSSDRRRTAAHRLYESLGFDQYGLGFRIYF